MEQLGEYLVQTWEASTWAFSDDVTFWVFQGGLVLLWIFALSQDRGLIAWFRKLRKKVRTLFSKRTGGLTLSGEFSATVKRGPESWNKFNLAYGILSVLVVQVVSASSAYEEHKVFFSLLDLGLLLYLCFYNGWFRNQLMKFVISSQEMQER